MVEIIVFDKGDRFVELDVSVSSASVSYVEVYQKRDVETSWTLFATESQFGGIATHTPTFDGELYDYKAEAYDSNDIIVDVDTTETISFLPKPTDVSVVKLNDGTYQISWTDNSRTNGDFQALIRPDGLPNFIVDDTIVDNSLEDFTLALNFGELGPDDYYAKIRIKTDYTEKDSETVQFSEERNGYTISLYDENQNRYRHLTSEEIKDVKFTRTHTGVSNYRFSTKYDITLENWAMSEVHLEYDDEFLFRGFLETIESDDLAAVTQCSGRGVELDLKSSGRSVNITSKLAHTAIEDYISNNTDFVADVVTPTPNVSTSDEEILNIDTSAEINNEISFDDTEPLVVDNGKIKTQQTGFFLDTDDAKTKDGTGFQTDPDYNDGNAEEFIQIGDRLVLEFTLDYDIPDGNVGLALRFDSVDAPEIDVRLDGTSINDVNTGLTSDLLWHKDGDSILPFEPNGIDAGTHELEFSVTDDPQNGSLALDVVFIYDTRYSYTFDDSVDSNGFLSSPQEYPDAIEVSPPEIGTRWNVTSASADVTMGESGETPEKLQLRFTGGSWYPSDGTEENSTSVTTSFPNEVGSTVDTRVILGRRDKTRTTQAPTTGFEGEQIDSWTVEIDGNDLAVFENQTVEGDDLRNIIRMSKFAGMRTVASHEPESKKLTVFRKGDVVKPEPDWTVENRRRIVDFRGYNNDVTIRGKKDDNGDRPVRNFSDQSEIDEFGKIHYDDIIPTLETSEDVASEARKELGERIQNSELSGKIEIVPKSIPPGFSYKVTWKDGSTTEIPCDEVSYEESLGSARGEVAFKRTLNIEDVISGVKSDTSRNKQVL